MNATEIFKSDEMLQRCWATHEAFRRLGFHPQELNLVLYKRQENLYAIGVLLKTRGKEVLVGCGDLEEDSQDEFQRKWTIVIKGLNSREIPEDLLQQTWHDSPYTGPGAVSLLSALYKKGILMPKSAN